MYYVIVIALGIVLIVLGLLFLITVFLGIAELRLLQSVERVDVRDVFQTYHDLNKYGYGSIGFNHDSYRLDENKDNQEGQDNGDHQGGVYVGDFLVSGRSVSTLLTPFRQYNCVYYKYKKERIHYETKRVYRNHHWKMEKRKITKVEVDDEKKTNFILKNDKEQQLIVIPPENAEYVKIETIHESTQIDFSDDNYIEHYLEYMKTSGDSLILGSVYARNDELFLEKTRKSNVMIVSNLKYDDLIKHKKSDIVISAIVSIILILAGAGILIYRIYYYG